MSTPTKAIAKTTNIWLASHWFANGLEFVRATARPVRAFRSLFVFADPDARALGLEREFNDDLRTQRLLSARRVMSEILDQVNAHGFCGPEDIDMRLPGDNRNG